MMSVSYPWIFYIPTLLMIVFSVGAIIYVATRSSEYSRPKRYAIIALTIMLLSQIVFPFFFNLVAGRMADPGDMVIVSGIVSIATSSAVLFAIALLLVAVFVDRKPSGRIPDWDPGGTPLADRPSDNPYAAPRQ